MRATFLIAATVAALATGGAIAQTGTPGGGATGSGEPAKSSDFSVPKTGVKGTTGDAQAADKAAASGGMGSGNAMGVSGASSSDTTAMPKKKAKKAHRMQKSDKASGQNG
jgi:hypothetical protein